MFGSVVIVIHACVGSVQDAKCIFQLTESKHTNPHDTARIGATRVTYQCDSISEMSDVQAESDVESLHHMHVI